jgi:hypothetical protein
MRLRRRNSTRTVGNSATSLLRTNGPQSSSFLDRSLTKRQGGGALVRERPPPLSGQRQLHGRLNQVDRMGILRAQSYRRLRVRALAASDRHRDRHRVIRGRCEAGGWDRARPKVLGRIWAADSPGALTGQAVRMGSGRVHLFSRHLIRARRSAPLEEGNTDAN